MYFHVKLIRETDIHKAYNTLAYMLELQKSVTDSSNIKAMTEISVLNNLFQEIKTSQAAAKLVLPKYLFYTLLNNHREKQYLLEGKLFDYCSLDVMIVVSRLVWVVLRGFD
jgi:hypothetical protein